MELDAFPSCKCLKTKDKGPLLLATFRFVWLVIFKMVLAKTVVAYLTYRVMNSKRVHPDLEFNLPGKIPGRYMKDAYHD